MERIWKDPRVDNAEGCCEINASDFEYKFIVSLSDKLAELLQVNWDDRRIVSALLQSNLKDELRDLLKQYLHSQLDIISDTLNREFGTKVKPDYQFATHAKLHEHITAIKMIILLNSTKGVPGSIDSRLGKEKYSTQETAIKGEY